MPYEIIPLPVNAKDITGKTFSRLTAIAPVVRSDRQGIFWLCLCECTSETLASVKKLNSGHRKSCGCIRSFSTAKCKTKHGLRKSPEYDVWVGITQRCLNQNSKSYKYYGGRGIQVNEAWKDSFEQFYSDMGPRPSKHHTIDRIDNNGDYTPENCRWATWEQQCRNRRSNRFYTLNGKTQCLTDWARDLGISKSGLAGRLRRGWSVEKALTTPLLRQL